MNALPPSVVVSAAAPLPRVSTADPATAIFSAARLLLPRLERGERVEAAALRDAMETAFGASDAAGAWDWKQAYEAGEAATVLFLRKYGRALFCAAPSPAARLALLSKIADLLPAHTRRSEEALALQQFSTPSPLGLAVLTAAAITPADRVLEPSAGTGLLAILAQIAGGALTLNELAETRASLLASLFPGMPVTRFDAAQIDDHLDPGVRPSVVLMNPPFSALAKVRGRVSDAALRHVSSALARLAPGGRLVAITGAGFSPEAPAWRDTFIQLQAQGTVVFTAAIDGAVYARHGTTIDTRLTVIDKRPADDPSFFPTSAGTAPDVGALLAWIAKRVPPRLPVAVSPRPPSTPGSDPRPAGRRPARGAVHRPAPALVRNAVEPEGVELVYETVDWRPVEGASMTEALYEPYTLQAVRIPAARPHPTRLVQSAIGRDGLGRAAEAFSSAATAGNRGRAWPALGCTARDCDLRRGSPFCPSHRIVDGRPDLRYTATRKKFVFLFSSSGSRDSLRGWRD